MSIVLSSGDDNSNDIQIDSLTDLSALQGAAPNIFKLGNLLVPGLNRPISQFPAGGSPITLSYKSSQNSWNLGDYNFGLSGEVDGSIAVFQPGSALFKYTKTFPTTIGVGLDTETSSTSSGTITGPAEKCYVGVTLKLSLSASVGGSGTIGSASIKGSADGSGTYSFQFFKAIDGNVLVKDALGQAFADFVLPLHPNTYRNLQSGDFLYHGFNATLDLGFGVSIGLDKVLFSDQYTAAFADPAKALPSVKMSAKVGVNADASLGVTFKYTDSFEAFLWKNSDTDSHLHLYRDHQTDLQFQAQATLGITAGPAATISQVSVANLVQEALPGTTGQVIARLAQGKFQPAVTNAVNDVQKKVNSWLQPLQEAKIELQAAIENTTDSCLLLDVTLDTTQVAFPTAWNSVIHGDFRQGLLQAKGGMTLDPGSGLEDFHTQKTSFTLNLFGKFTGEWTEEFVDNYSIVYAGNNTFNLVRDIGVETITNVNGSGSKVELYFAANATQAVDGTTTVGEPDLHLILQATKNPAFAARIADFFRQIAAGATAQQLLNVLQSSSIDPNSTPSLELVFAPSAYKVLSYSDVAPHGGPFDESADTLNYNCFARSAYHMDPAWNPAQSTTAVYDVANFSVYQTLDLSYKTWRKWNIVGNGIDLATGSPDRHSEGPILGNSLAYLNDTFDSPPNVESIAYVLQVASRFMNFCEFLTKLADPNGANGLTSWGSLCTELDEVIHNEVSADFLPATGFALTLLLKDQQDTAVAFSGPTANAVKEPSIAVTVHFS